MPSGSVLFLLCIVLTVLIIVDFAYRGGPRGDRPYLVACRAASFAFLPNANSLHAGTHTIRMELLPSLNTRVASYIWSILA
jgi:hypothetical protein